MANEVNNETVETAQTEETVNQDTIIQTPADNSAPEVEPTVNTTVNAPVSEEPEATGDVDFGSILEQFEQEQTIFHAGELVTGKVVGVSDRGVLVDFGYKSEGIVGIEEFTSHEGEISIQKGDEVEVVIRSIHAGDAPPMLSRNDALQRQVWTEIEKAFNSETPVTGRVIDQTKGGLRVDLGGIEAFLPGSQIDSRPIRNLDSYRGQDIEAKIVKFSRRRNNIVLSRKILTDEVVNAQKAETFDNIAVGYIIEGTIKNLTDYGAFVDIGGIDGLLHVTDMSWGRLHNPNEMFKPNDTVQIKILKLDREKEKISLGYKQLLPDPWSTVVEVYPVNSKLKGKVSSVTDYGVFVELEPGVEGLVHVSEVSWSKHSKSPRKLFKAGDDVDVQVLGVDTVARRISLGMKQLMENPWDTIEQRFPVGSKVRGKVRNLTDFGAFVEVEDGIEGLVHVSDITWSKKVKHPKDVLKKDQEVDAVVMNIDKRTKRLSLSIKELTPSAWEAFVATHRPGDVVKGKISRFAGFGVFVELGEGLEGLCHISELSDERVERPEQVVQMGQEMDFKILRIEHEDQRIGLSARAVGKEDEPIVDTKMYSSEAKGGMASLGELANLKFGKPAEESKEATKEEAVSAKKTKKANGTKVEETEDSTIAESSEQTETPELAEDVVSETTETTETAETVETVETDSVADDSVEDAEETPVAEETPTAETVEMTEESSTEDVKDAAADEKSA